MKNNKATKTAAEKVERICSVIGGVAFGIGLALLIALPVSVAMEVLR